MRFVSLVAVVVGLGVANASARDPFADVTNEPRPSEFIHWDAESFTGRCDVTRGRRTPNPL